MAKVTLAQIKKEKKKHCNGTKGSYAKMRSLCKSFVDEANNAAPIGKKGKAKDKAKKSALAIIEGNCAVGRERVEEPKKKRKKR